MNCQHQFKLFYIYEKLVLGHSVVMMPCYVIWKLLIM
uniref:Uncharacterized protein n=1 Tax=Arundo donax TaxID=35708 RepID=A0A0A9CSR9_ARUDO